MLPIVKSEEPLPQGRMPLEWLDWEKLARETTYDLEALAARSGYSLRTLQRHVAGKFRQTLHGMIADFRMTHAAALLASGVSVKEVAFQLGFKTTSHFIRNYRGKFGTTPGAHAGRMQTTEGGDRLGQAA